MSADSTPPPPPEPVPPTPEELPSEARAIKRRYKKPEASEAGASGGDPEGEIIILSSLLQNLLERKQGTQAPVPEGEPRAKVNRFVSRGSAATTTTEAATSPAEPSDPGLPREETAAAPTPAPSRKDNSTTEAMASIAFPKFEPRPYAAEPSGWERSGSTWGRGILYFAFAALLALGAFLVGRGDARRTDAAALNSRNEVGLTDLWSPAYTDALDKALAADHGGDLPAALRMASDLAKNMKPNPVLQAYRATLNTRLGHTNDVEADLSRLLNPTTAPADAAVLNEAQGFNYTRRRDFDHAIDCFAAIALVRPLDTGNLLHLAEAYRRKGRLADAADTFRLAILRLAPGTLPESEARREYLSYEQRLTLVENGRDGDFKEDLAAHLTTPSPAPEWLLTAAAVALQKGDMSAAVDALKKAQAVLPPARFDARMSDYFFRSFAYHPEMNAFLSIPTPDQQNLRQQGMDFYIDP